MDLNDFILTAHCEKDHRERWEIMRKVVNNDLGIIICSVEDRGAHLCLSSTGVYAIVNMSTRVIVTAYLPSRSRLERLYARLNEETPREVIRMMRRNEKKERKIMEGWA